MTTYHIEKTGPGPQFLITVEMPSGIPGNIAPMKVDIAVSFGSNPNMLHAFEEACRMVAYANVAVALASAVERVNTIDNSNSPSVLLQQNTRAA